MFSPRNLENFKIREYKSQRFTPQWAWVVCAFHVWVFQNLRENCTDNGSRFFVMTKGRTMKQRLLTILYGIVPVVLLAACGDDSKSSNEDSQREVQSIYDLGSCTEERNGDTVFVVSEATDYLCYDKKWLDITNTLPQPSDSSDSVDSTDQNQPQQRIVETRNDLSLCDQSIAGFQVYVRQDSLDFHCDGIKWQPDSARGYLVKNLSITGAAQKGPFKFDSPLLLKELRLLDDSLEYSGLGYVDEISSNKGDFVIPKVNLIYPYAELMVTGLWRNEVTGEWSSDTMTLQALTDLSERTEANINLLTHLEYERVKTLVSKGYSLSAAKKQAEYEIMTALGFATTVENAEDLKTFADTTSGASEANATLMAISLLFIGDRNDSAIAATIENFRDDITPDGTWDDSETKTEMADWAEGFDKSTVRTHVKNWNISGVPEFEEYLNIFWYNSYGLGGCAENRRGTILQNSNELSKNYGVSYICDSTGWHRVKNSENDTLLCNGDNDGEKTTKGELFFVCRNNEWKEIAESEYYVVKNISVTGAAQKGPFKFDSPLELREARLQADSLVLTERTYPDEISSNKGDFVIPKVSLAYPYAVLTVRGQWRNEITGEFSNSQLTLRALTDLSGRIEVNINLLTHLEYDRAMDLIKKGYSVFAAKKQAEYEIMTAFGFATTIENAEDLKMFSTANAANSTLMAISLLFVADRTEAEFLAAIDNFKQDMVGDGVWNDLATKANMADWAESFDGSAVRANVKNWNISDIPSFETELTTFWNNAYGLGGCGRNRYGVVSPVTNAQSKNYGVHYICETTGWRKATDYEKDTYQWTGGTTGEIKKGNITNSYYTYNGTRWVVADRENVIGLCTTSNAGAVEEYNNTYYICKSGSWTTAVVLEYDTYQFGTGDDGEVRQGRINKNLYYVYENGAWRASASEIENNLGACVASREGVVDLSGNTYYICKSCSWRTATVLEYDTYGWTSEATGEVKKGNVTDTYYTYNGSKWVVAERENAIGPCTTNNTGVVEEYNNAYYICKSGSWTTATTLEYDTYQFGIGTDGEVRQGRINNDLYYVYENGAWRSSASEIEDSLGACVANREGEKHTLGNKYYICENRNWKQISAQEYSLGYCTTSNIGIVEKLNNVYYICKSNGWTTATTLEYDTYQFGIGTDGEVRQGRINNNLYYVYENGAWRASANEIENNLGACVASREGEKHKLGNKYYICENRNWEQISVQEYNLGYCTTANIGTVKKLNNVYYICKNNQWQTATVLEYDTYEKICTTDGAIVNGRIVSANKYVCDNDSFRAANESEISLNKGCVSYTEGEIIRKPFTPSIDSIFSCISSIWNKSHEITYGTLIDERDNKTYKTIIIGSQTWMAENLNYEYKIESTNNTDSVIYGNYCYTDNCFTYGRYYTWAAAMDSAGNFSTNSSGCGFKKTCSPAYPARGICPENWHLPSKTEWETLITTVDDEATATAGELHRTTGKMLRTTSGWRYDYNGTDEYGFSALPAGYFYHDSYWDEDHFDLVRSSADFWSSTEYISSLSINIGNNAYSMYLAVEYDTNESSYQEYGGFTYQYVKSRALSVRCVKD